MSAEKPFHPPENMPERRQYRRFLAIPGIYAALRNSGEKIGQVIDISRGGLSFCYIADGTQQNDAGRVDLFSPEGRFILKRLPVRTACDLPVDQDVPCSSIPVRKRGLEFLDIQPHQRQLLDHVLRQHTLDVAP